jgi:hypothetical protein
MKGIVLIGVTLLTALGIFAVLTLTQRQATDKLVREDTNGFFHEKKQEMAVADSLSREAFGEPVPRTFPPTVSEPVWVERLEKGLEKGIEACDRLIKNLPTSLRLRLYPRLAPRGVYFTLTYLSVQKPSGITGVEPGTQVVCVKDEGPVLLVKAGDLEFEAKRQNLTNVLDIADLAIRNDAEAQRTVASYIAQQQQAIDQREDRRRMQASGQH